MSIRILITALAALLSLPALAAEPAEGTLNLDNMSLEYGGGPFVNANVVHQTDPSQPTCMPPALECDVFTLTLDFPEDIADIYPTAIVRMVFTWVDITNNGVVDFDFFIEDADGNVINDSAVSASNPEVATLLLSGGLTTYRIVAVPFLALGDSYTATVTVDLGEPVDAPARSLSSRRAAGGSLGWLVLLLGGLAAWRRR